MSRTPPLRALAAAALAMAALAASPLVRAQSGDPLTNASVEEFKRLLNPDSALGSMTKRFKPTQPPDAQNRCTGNVEAAGGGGSGTKTLVVEYNDASAVQVNLQFGLASDSITGSYARMLDNLAQAINSEDLKSFKYALAGHTDRSGNNPGNLQLSCARAIAAREYLVSRGVSRNRISAFGFGSDRLLASHAGSPDSPVHRRVEIRANR